MHHDATMTFSIHDDKEKQMKQILTVVYDALREKGMNNPSQIPPHNCKKS